MSGKRKAWDLNPHDPKVARFSKPARRAVSGCLPYVFKRQWTHRESNPDFQSAELVSSRWTMSPFVFQWTAWESNPSHRPCKGQSPPTACRPVCCFERSVRESNPVSVLTTDVCCRNTYRPSCMVAPQLAWTRRCSVESREDATSTRKVIPAGIEPALSCMSRRRLRRWTTGSLSVTEVGVEPTKSPRSRRDRFACLRTRP